MSDENLHHSSIKTPVMTILMILSLTVMIVMTDAALVISCDIASCIPVRVLGINKTKLVTDLATYFEVITSTYSKAI